LGLDASLEYTSALLIWRMDHPEVEEEQALDDDANAIRSRHLWYDCLPDGDGYNGVRPFDTPEIPATRSRINHGS
jgi:hypothetical protein